MVWLSNCQSFASNFEQVANLLWAQANSASFPSMGWEMSSSLQATGWRPSVADWGGGGMTACKNRVSSCMLMWAMDGRIACCGIISSCQSAATCEILKCFWLRVHVRSAIPSTAFLLVYHTEADFFLRTSEISDDLIDPWIKELCMVIQTSPQRLGIRGVTWMFNRLT